MGFDFTLIAPRLPSHCGFSSVLGCGVSSLVKSRVFLLTAASCDSGALARGSESMSFYSAVLVNLPNPFTFKVIISMYVPITIFLIVLGLLL